MVIYTHLDLLEVMRRGLYLLYMGQSVVMKVDPTDGSEIWTDINPNSEYSVALVESTNDYIYSAKGTRWAEDLSITKIDKFGNRFWTEDIPNTSDVIPIDLCISDDDIIYFGGHTGRIGLEIHLTTHVLA